MPPMPDNTIHPQHQDQPDSHEPGPASNMKNVFTSHTRRWQDFHYVYPVISRRSGGLSIGINLNIDKACNFDCVYCCVDRSTSPVRTDVDLNQVRDELARMLDLAVTGNIWSQPQFAKVDPRYQRINDIAFSGDGEPTAYPHFLDAASVVVKLKQALGLEDVKVVVITNATMFDRPGVQKTFKLLDAHQGEVWAKLDAGTDSYYQLVDRTKFPLRKVLDNILTCGREREIVIQSLFMQVHGQPITDAEFDAYLDRLHTLIDSGCRIKFVQLYTTARRTAQPYVTPLTDEQLDHLANQCRASLPSLPVEVYYGVA